MIAAFDYLPVFSAVFWKSGVALGAALCVSRLLRKKSADLRRLVLSAAVVAMFVAAAALPLLPRWTAVTPLWFQLKHPAVQAVSEQPNTPATIDDTTGLTVPDTRPAPAQTQTRRIDFRTWLNPWLLPLMWFAGAAALLARFAINLRGLHNLREASEPVTDAGLLADVARSGRQVALWRNEAIAAPVTWGIARPVILVPAGFEQLPAECRDAVLRHELAHIQAYDFLMRSLAETARALIWFQPLMWIVWRQLREEQELACDNRVLAAGGKPSAYAKLLLEWECRPGLDSLIAVGIAHRSCLRRRLYALLDPDLRRGTVARAIVAGVWFLALAAALPLAAIGFTQEAPVPPAPAPMAAAPPPVQMAQAQPQAPTPAPAPAAQPAPAPKPKFDVASIKPCQPGDGPGRGGSGDMGANGGVNPNMPEGIGGYFPASPGRLDVTCGSILTMVSFAYIGHGSPLLNSVGGFMREAEEIQGVPKWALAARYTIHAETDDPVANGPTQRAPGERGAPLPAAMLLYGPMLQGLLEERFQLKIRRVTAEAPMYALTVAKGGLKLKPIKVGDCAPVGKGPRMSWFGPDDQQSCNWVSWPSHGPNRTLVAGGITMERLAASLTSFVMGRKIFDQTGITGLFPIHLEYAPDENTRCLEPAEFCTVDPNSDIPPAATIFTALEQQLGLKLEPIKGPQEHIVIDSVERPSEN
jgi:bla regulator protein BlaR1